MSNDPINFNFPFVNMMPDDMGDPNLILNSMKMMGQAWQNFATVAPQASGMAIDPKELDKRIEELKAVEAWLKLNLSMLSSSIHSLEIQKANLQHFNSLMEMMSEPIKAAQATAASTAKQPQDEKQSQAGTQENNPTAQSDDTDKAPEDNNDEEASFAEASSLVQEQALNWFNLLGEQFKTIVASVASATPTEANQDNPLEETTDKPTEPTEGVKSSAKKATKKVVKKAAKRTTQKTAGAKKSSTTVAKKTAATKKTTTNKGN